MSVLMTSLLMTVANKEVISEPNSLKFELHLVLYIQYPVEFNQKSIKAFIDSRS